MGTDPFFPFSCVFHVLRANIAFNRINTVAAAPNAYIQQRSPLNMLKVFNNVKYRVLVAAIAQHINFCIKINACTPLNCHYCTGI